MVPAAFWLTGRAVGWVILLGLVLPVLSASVLGLSLSSALALVASAFLIEYGAVPIGIGLGLPVVYVLCAVTSVGAGIFLGITGIIDTMGEASGRVAGFLKKTRSISERSKMFDRYGIAGLFPCCILFGVYICAPVSRLFGWRLARSFAVTLAGYSTAAVFTALATLGLIRVFAY